MNPLQSGTPASAITPQGYKNSTQNSNFQGGYSGSDLLESSSASYTLQIDSQQTKLTVKNTGSNQVLGASSVSSGSQVSNTTAGSGFGIYIPILILVASAALFIYFYQKYRKFVEPLESLDIK